MKDLNFMKDVKVTSLKSLTLKHSQSISKMFGSKVFPSSFLKADSEQGNFIYIKTQACGLVLVTVWG